MQFSIRKMEPEDVGTVYKLLIECNYSGGSMYKFRRCELLPRQSILNVIN